MEAMLYVYVLAIRRSFALLCPKDINIRITEYSQVHGVQQGTRVRDSCTTAVPRGPGTIAEYQGQRGAPEYTEGATIR